MSTGSARKPVHIHLMGDGDKLTTERHSYVSTVEPELLNRILKDEGWGNSRAAKAFGMTPQSISRARKPRGVEGHSPMSLRTFAKGCSSFTSEIGRRACEAMSVKEHNDGVVLFDWSGELELSEQKDAERKRHYWMF